MKSYIELVVSLIGVVVGIFGLAAYLSGLTNDVRLLRIISIVAYIVFAGGIIYFVFKSKTASQNLRRLSLGVLYFLTIPFFIWVGSWLNSSSVQLQNPCEVYGIKIVEPPNGYVLENGQVTIRGSHTKRPPDESVHLIGFAGGQYWPHNVDGVEITETAWRGRSFGDGDYTELAVYVGENGRILFDYFQKAGAVDSSYPGIDELPADVIECDSVYIPTP